MRACALNLARFCHHLWISFHYSHAFKMILKSMFIKYHILNYGLSDSYNIYYNIFVL